MTALRRCSLFILALLATACGDSPSAPRTGFLAVNIVGLPQGASGAVTITGANGFARSLTTTDTLENLVPGRYSIVASTVNQPSGVYEASSPTQQVDVAAVSQPASVTVSYAITTGSIAFNVTGLPQGAPAAIAVTGPSGFYRQVTESITIASLTPGSYVITSNSVSTANGHVYSPVPLNQTINVLAGETPRNVNARYNLTTGALEVSISGLPAQQNAAVVVTGPGGFSAAVTASTTLLGLFPGTYAVVASPVAAGSTYSPNPLSQSIEVPASLTPARATITYVETNQPPPPLFNLTVDGMYVTQAVQTYGNAVPLLAGMPGLLRVFVKANAPNTVSPTVRLRIYDGSTLSETLTLLPNAPSVTTNITEGAMASSWNALIPASRVKPGLRLLVDVDPTNTVTESDETDNTFPRDGTPFAPVVEFTTPLNLTVVPVRQTATGLTGNVSLANLDEYLAFARKVLPIKDYRLTLHETFTTSADTLFSNNGNNAWLQVLSEINTLRVAEGTTDYYMGVVGTQYTSGVAGMAFAPGKASVTWDRFPAAAPVAAHELAHSLGRLHAPCGGAGSPDAGFPHASGTIGVWGYDFATGALKSPGTSDLMGYCGFGWISDYTYTGILNYRLNTNNSAASGGVTESFVQGPDVRQTLVVWGRIEKGNVILEPAFTARTRSLLPARNGPYRIEGRSAQGQVVFSFDFAGERPADVDDPTARQFAFAIPLADEELQSVATISLIGPGSRTDRGLATGGSAGSVGAEFDAPGSVRFRVDDPRVPLAVVRDRTSQQILAFIRPGQPVRVRTRATEFDVQLSNGVRSTTRTLRPVRR